MAVVYIASSLNSFYLRLSAFATAFKCIAAVSMAYGLKTTSVVAASSRGVVFTTCRYGDRGRGRLVGLLFREVCFSAQRILLLKLYTVSPFCLFLSVPVNLSILGGENF